MSLGLSALSPATARAAQPRIARIGQAPHLPAGTQPLSAVPADQVLRIALALKPRDAAALAAYASAVSDPGSPLYRHYLRPGAFAVRFGAAPATVARLRRTLSAAGLSAGALSANHLSLDVVAPTGRLETALHTELARVLVDHRAALVNTQAPALPVGIASAVQAVVGLDGLATMRSQRVPARIRRRPLTPRAAAATTHVRSRQVPQACSAASSAAARQGADTATQIASAYRFSGLFTSGDEGAGVNVGVYELEPDAPGDIAAYQACYGTDTPVSYQSVDGGAGSGAGSGEAAFDIEQLIGLAPRANLIVYQAPNSNADTPGSGPYDLFSQIIGQDRVSVITNSWGECEAVEGLSSARAESTLFEEAAVQGQTIVSAAGDTGAQDCLGAGATPDYSPAVDDPGSQPFVTDVGGTSLTALGPAPTETVWNNGGSLLSAFGAGAGAGGGGVSRFWTMPDYQAGAAARLGVVNANSSGATCGVSSGYCREVPDVSASADPNHGYLIYYNGSHSVAGQPSGWQATGGTSGAAPLWAAAFALADAERSCAGAPIGFANPALYAVAASGEGTLFNDVTSGNNDFTGTNHGAFPATAGYDMASGLGTPNVTALAGALCAASLRVSVPRSLESFIHTARTLRVGVVAPPGTTTIVRVSGLPRGLGYAPASHVISGRAGVTGRFTVHVSVTDSDGAVRAGAFLWIIAGRPRVSAVRLSGTRERRPVLTLALSTGRAEVPLTAVRLTLPAGLVLRRGASVSVWSGGRRVSRTLRGSGRTITLSLRRGVSRATVRFTRGALSESAGVAAAVRRRRVSPLTLTATLHDAANVNSPARVSVRPVN
ncbi:MAG TPA: S53 family peptidase [Solirubrobacteraceae bacterium]|nr:S53 family peptidase [Solirubrobacteraceae bacterium]